MKNIWKYLKKYWVYALASPLFMTLEVAMSLLLPAKMAEIIDVGVPQHDLGLVTAIGLSMLLYTLIGAVGGGMSSVTAITAALRNGSRFTGCLVC